MQIQIIYLATFGKISLDFVLEDINDKKTNFAGKKTTFHPIKFFCEKRDIDIRSKRERMEIIDPHLK